MATKKNNRWIWILSAAVVLLLIVAGIKAKNNPKGEKVTVSKVMKRTIKETVAASGKVFPEIEVKISSDVSGEVVELLVQEGDSVKKGQLLCRINPDTYVSSVERGEAGVNSARANASQSKTSIKNAIARKAQADANYNNAKANFDRNKTLFNEGVVSKEVLDNAANAVAVAQATLNAAEADIAAAEDLAKAADYNIASNVAGLKELRTSLKRTSIYAPASGIISKLNIEKGERVVGTMQMAGTEIMRIADFSSMEVQVDVSENDIPRVEIGDITDIEIDAFIGRKFKGKVYQIANSASNTGSTSALNTDQVTNFVVKIRIDPSSYADLLGRGKKHPFRPGMSATVEIATNEVANVLSVPIQSVTTRDKNVTEKEKKEKEDWEVQKVENKTASISDEIKEVVFILEGDKVKMVQVKSGIQDDAYIEIISGLDENAEVVTGPYDAVSRKLKDGDKYHIEKEDKAKEK
jgi:HlyD family secretion protein